MNREILFRGKDAFTGEWVYGFICLYDDEARIFVIGDGWHEVDPAELQKRIEGSVVEE